MERRHRHSRLVIGIGNPLRGDDGIGALLAELEAVIPAGAGAPDSHRLEPAQLLAISQALYGRAPAACLLQVPAHAFEHGNTLSVEIQAALPRAQALMQGWLKRHA